MANDESLLREVDEGLAEDRLSQTLRDRTSWLIGGAAIIVVAVAGYQFYSSAKAREAADAARGLSAVLADETAGPEEREASLDLFLEDAPSGYAALARFRLAASQAAAGERVEALANYRAVAEDGALTPRMRDLASIRAAHLALPDGRSAVIDIIGDLETDASPLGFFAREALGLAALKDGDYQTAQATFEDIVAASSAPTGVRRRAEEFAALAAAGSANGAIEWPDLDAAVGVNPLDVFGGDLSSALEAAGRGEDAALQSGETASDETSVVEANEGAASEE
ncbi:MAG: tetratricopeptide repeat protein [Pseudomonadota bacterium]